jgi:hypothetical protein
MRRGFGLLAAVVAAADIAIATAVDNNDAGIPTVPSASQAPMVLYGIALFVLGLWAVATSFAGQARRAASGGDPQRERTVIHALRDLGWYVADDVLLPHVDVDHIAVGPAGVLAVQTRWTDRADSRGKPAARARIAAHQIRRALASREIDVEVVPAVLMFGPGLTEEPGGVKVADAVAILNGYQAGEWLDQLGRRSLLDQRTVDAVRGVIADLREQATEPAGRRQPAMPPPSRTPALVR